jgi:hemoglobin
MRHQSAITPEMFARWLVLWEACATRNLPPEAGRAIVAKAHRIAESLQTVLFQPLPAPRH